MLNKERNRGRSNSVKTIGQFINSEDENKVRGEAVIFLYFFGFWARTSNAQGTI